jgi:hypothetical protein
VQFSDTNHIHNCITVITVSFQNLLSSQTEILYSLRSNSSSTFLLSCWYLCFTFYLYEFSVLDNVSVVVFSSCVWILSLIITFSSFIYVVAILRTSFIFIYILQCWGLNSGLIVARQAVLAAWATLPACWFLFRLNNIPLFVLLIHLFADKHLSCFHLLAIVKILYWVLSCNFLNLCFQFF